MQFQVYKLEAAKIITSTFKSSMEIHYFNGVRFPNILNRKPQVDACFSRFKVSINLNIIFMLIWLVY
jgi:hypothetical protein